MNGPFVAISVVFIAFVVIVSPLWMSASSLPCRIMFILDSAQVALSFSWP